MKKILITIFASSLIIATPAFADDKVTNDEGKAVQAAIAAWGCNGGTMEKETEGSGVFEVDDAQCSGGQYDVKLSADKKVISISQD